eukprot:6729182-Prymnesium_polylepis.1
MPTPCNHARFADCLWHQPLEYDDQLDLILLLQRIVEHFASSALSLELTPALDASRMFVPAAIAAVADALLRQVATDIPSN